MTFPTVVEISEEEKARIREEFGAIGAEIAANPQILEEQPPPRRRRGRPPGSKNKAKPSDYAPVSDSEDIPTLATPPMTTRDQKEVAKRLAGILEGVTGVAAVAKPYFQMNPDEAEAIAVPLASYLIRTEATSGAARQILEEYDIAAFVIALAAYVIRVYRDFDAERKSKPNVHEPRDSRRTSESQSPENVRESGVQSQVGEERPASRQFASTPERGWIPSDV